MTRERFTRVNRILQSGNRLKNTKTKTTLPLAGKIAARQPIEAIPDHDTLI